MEPTQVDEESPEAKETSSYIIMAFSGSLPERFKNMVYAKWMRALRHGNEYFKLSDSRAYYAAYARLIDRTLADPYTIVRIASLKDEPDTALGFSVSAQNVLHFVVTFKDYRKLGIARSLVPFEVKTITHLTKMGAMLWSTKLPGAVFNPFL